MLGHLNIIESIICDTFAKEFVRNENPLYKRSMEISFNLTVDYDKEDGYRHLIIRLFGTGYITVLANETWIVTPNDDLHLKDPKYDEDQTGWIFVGCHDSCWRDFVHKILYEYSDRLMNINTTATWYKSIELTEEELDNYRKLESNQPGWPKN